MPSSLPLRLETALPLSRAARFSNEVMLWLGLILVAGILMAVIALVIRRKVMDRPDDTPPMGFTLKDLRRLHAEGQISDEELAQAEQRTLKRSRSLYLGDEEEGEESGDEGDADPSLEGESSTDNPPPEGGGAENPGDDPDKNG